MKRRFIVYEPKPQGTLTNTEYSADDNNYRKSYDFKIKGYTDSNLKSLGEYRNLINSVNQAKITYYDASNTSSTTNIRFVGNTATVTKFGVTVTIYKDTGIIRVEGTTTRVGTSTNANESITVEYNLPAPVEFDGIKGRYLWAKLYTSGTIPDNISVADSVGGVSVIYGYINGRKDDTNSYIFLSSTDKQNYPISEYKVFSYSGWYNNIQVNIPIIVDNVAVTYVANNPLYLKPYITRSMNKCPSEYVSSGGSKNVTITDKIRNAQISSVKGKTVKFNQLINPANYPVTSTSNNVTFTPNADGSIAVVVGEGGASATTYYQLKSGNFSKTTDKFLLKGGANNGSNSTYRIAFDLYNNTSWVVGVSDYGNGAFLNTTADFNTLSVNIVIYKNCPAGTYVFKPQLFDLTAMYGSGNEPSTVAAFTAEHPKDIYGYDSGSLKNSLFSGIKEYDSSSNLIDGVTFDDIELKGVGTAKDEINLETNKKITRCATVNLGSLTWIYDSTYLVFVANVSGLKNITGDNGTIICQNYSNSPIQSSSSPDKTIYTRSSGANNGVGIKDTSYTSAASFKTAMSGVMLTFELETSTEEDINLFTRFMLLDSMSIEVQNDNKIYNANPTVAIKYEINEAKDTDTESFSTNTFSIVGEPYLSSQTYRTIDVESPILRKVGTAYDYRTYDTFYQNIYAKYIGDHSNTQITYANNTFKSSYKVAVPEDTATVGNILIEGYTTLSYDEFLETTLPKAVAIDSEGYIKIRNTSYTTPSEFITGQTYVVMLYELKDVSKDTASMPIVRLPLLVPSFDVSVSDGKNIKNIDEVTYYNNVIYDTYEFATNDNWVIGLDEGNAVMKLAIPNGSTLKDTNCWVEAIETGDKLYDNDNGEELYIKNSELCIIVGSCASQEELNAMLAEFGATEEEFIAQYTSLLEGYVLKYIKE